MKGMTIRRAAECCCGELSCDLREDVELGRIVIDSREIQPGDIFIAFKGEKADGHDYIKAAFDRGAACCLAQRVPEGETRPIILVPDVQDALELISAEYRKEVHIPLIGITGSVGKTSAKEMIAAVLSPHFSVLKTEKNFNNCIGVPMTLSHIGPEHDVAVIEMGISDFGEMTRLALMCRPTMAVYTMIGQAHLEFLHDRQGVFEAKTEMLDYIPKDGTVLVNGDDDLLREINCAQRVISFGLGENCDIRADEIKTDNKGYTDCRINYGDRHIPVHIPAFGRHMVYAALEGAGLGILLGLSDEEIIKGVASYETVGRRAALSDTGRIHLVDDCYNANPDSVKSGIDSIAGLPGRHVCILGDMLELGENELELHREVGRYALDKGIELVLSCGELGKEIALGAEDRGRYFESREELISALPELIEQGDIVLVKASRRSRFELVSEALKKL